MNRPLSTTPRLLSQERMPNFALAMRMLLSNNFIVQSTTDLIQPEPGDGSRK